MALLLPFISIYTRNFHDANYYIPSLAFLMVLNGICYSVKVPQSMLMISAGMYKEQRWRATSQAIIILLGGVILVHFWGLQGVMLASIISNVYRSIDLLIYVPKHITHNSIFRTARRMVGVFVNTAIICIPAFIINIQPSSYVAWAGYAVAFGIYGVAVVTIMAYIFDRTEFRAIKRRLVKMIFRRNTVA